VKRIQKVLHRLLILNFVLEIIYGFYMVFFVIGGRRWPLFARAVETPIEVILKRRLYAIEAWLAISGLAIYLAITEFLPRKLATQQEQDRRDQKEESGEELPG